jgi:hypothetical protein
VNVAKAEIYRQACIISPSRPNVSGVNRPAVSVEKRSSSAAGADARIRSNLSYPA